MIKRIILVGHAASGKDHARKVLETQGLSYGVPYTTREPRIGEKSGVDYYFITKQHFAELSKVDYWYESFKFNGWSYGTPSHQFIGESANVFIMTPHGVSLIKPSDRKDSLVIFFCMPEDIRKDRLSIRNDSTDTIDRRLAADELDFSKYTDWDVQITDPNFNLVELMSHEYFMAIEFNDKIYNTLYKAE